MTHNKFSQPPLINNSYNILHPISLSAIRVDVCSNVFGYPSYDLRFYKPFIHYEMFCDNEVVRNIKSYHLQGYKIEYNEYNKAKGRQVH